MGTAAYMSPEQARGHHVDKRADIWSFGVVLFEMLSGRRLFEGENAGDTLAEVLKKDIDWSQLPPNSPPQVANLLKRCLERDRKKRLRDLGDARVEVAAASAAPAGRNRIPWIIAAAAALAACLFGWTAWRATRTLERPLLRFNAEVGAGAELGRAILGGFFALSPDGSRLAATIRGTDGVVRLANRLLDQTQLTVLPGTENAHSPFFSPDSQWIGFFADGKLKKVSVQGGSPIVLCEARTGRGASWGDDGNIIFAPDIASPLVRVGASGGTPAAVTTLQKGERTHRHPFVLPGGKGVLFTAHSGTRIYDEASIDIVSFPSGERKTLHRGGYAPVLLASGHLIYAHKGSIFAAPFDLAGARLTGAPAPVVQDLSVRGPGSDYSVSTTGVLAYLSGPANYSGFSLVWLDSSGATTPLHASPGLYSDARISPDGKHLVVEVATGQSTDLWTKDLDRGTFSRLTFLPGFSVRPTWTPNGKHIVFINQTSRRMYIVPADGSGEARPLADAGEMHYPHAFSPDARNLVLVGEGPVGSGDIYSAPVDWSGDFPKLGPAQRLVRVIPSTQATIPRLSRDGKWLAYSAQEGVRNEVYVRPFPGPGGKWQISTNGGAIPEWSPTTNQLFFADAEGRPHVIDYAASAGTFQPSPPRLWSLRQITATDAFAVAPDGKRLLVTLRPDLTEMKITHITFLLNFFDEVRRRLRTGG
jgi:serine/threonine-protein kinase